MFKNPFLRLSSSAASPVFQMQLFLSQKYCQNLPSSSLAFNSFFQFSNSSRNNRPNPKQQLTLAPSPSAKLTRHDVEIQQKGAVIHANFNGKKVSYELGKTIKGATLGDTNRLILMCTCNVCGHKIVKTFTKKAYKNGVVIIFCDHCENSHLIADNLGWFRDEPVNIEDLANEKGNPVLKLYNDSKMQQVLEQLEFVGVKHTATLESDRLGVPSQSLLQRIIQVEPPQEEIQTRERRQQPGGK